MATDGVIGDITMRETEPLTPSHPRPYVYLTDPIHILRMAEQFARHTIRVTTRIQRPACIWGNILAVREYTARNNGPQYEAWDYGTFTGDVLSFGDTGLFENAIDLDGDGGNDVVVGLSILGLGVRGEGWDVELRTD